ncbi:MAG: tagaturonate reductase [Succinivibrio sp.]|nr:tagaturonate reductase [Succinivibrio sp.]
MNTLNLGLKPELKSDLPVRALQFGEGNFLRGFLDWMLFRLNQKGLFCGRVVAVQPTPRGRVIPKLNAQDSLYTTILHGIVDGRETEVCEVINTIAQGLNPYDVREWQKIKETACQREVKFVFSNTTEAGISYVKENGLGEEAPSSFPAKLTACLYERFKAFKGTDCACDAGMIIMPCELLDDNGTKLRNIVLQHIEDWGLEDEFKAYVTEDCTFLNTLVDRVVSGYPIANAAEYETKLGYNDALMTCGEMFHFLAIEGSDAIKEQLPFDKAGLNVVVAPDITPYRLRKVRILNGAHTSNVPAAFLAGLDTVDQMMTNSVTGPFARSVIYDEIIPAVNLDKGMLTEFADDVVNRFLDPSMHHQLSSILMNCTSKIKARVLPSILDARKKGILPKKLCFALAAYFALYKNCGGVSPVKVVRAGGKSGEFVDDAYAVEALSKAWSYYSKSESSAQLTVKSILSDIRLWGRDLSSDVDLTSLTAKLTHAVITDGIEATMKDLLENS